MRLYNSIGPNPRVVRMFAAEKGIDLPFVEVDLMGGENRQSDYREKNPDGRLPCLELDDGSFLSEIIPICEYIEEKHPDPVLVGASAEERAATRMWVRRIDLNIVEPLVNGFRFAEGQGLFKDRMHLIPQAADDLKAIARENLAWLDGLMGDRQWIVGDRFTLADVFLFAFLDFGAQVGQGLPEDCRKLAAWLDRAGARPSAAASA